MRVKVSDLIIDEKLLELRPINLYFVSRYRQAVRSGAIFPPPIIEAGTKRVVSGNHRVTTYLDEYGPDHEIEVVSEKFKDEAAVIRRFAEENSKHGNPLSGISQKSIVQALLKYGDTPETVAQVLNIPVKRVELMAGISVIVIGNGRKKEMRPIKHGLEHMVGQSVKVGQYKEHIQADRGLPARTMASQLIRWIENGWINQDDQKTMEIMLNLRDALDGMMEKAAAVG